MSLTYLSLAGVTFAGSMVLYYQWLLAERQGKSDHFKTKRWIGAWIGLAVSAALILLFIQTS